MSNLNVTRENVLNLTNVDLKAFLASVGIKKSVTKASRDEAEKAAIAHFEAAAAAPKAEAAPVTSIVIAPEQTATARDGEQEEKDRMNAEQAARESEADEAARIEAEAAAEAEKTEAAQKRAAARASNSVGVALSWKNPETRAARLTRDGVRVTAADGTDATYKSVAEAFRALRLPFEKHIRFRLSLKASRKEVIEHNGVAYTFEM